MRVELALRERDLDQAVDRRLALVEVDVEDLVSLFLGEIPPALDQLGHLERMLAVVCMAEAAGDGAP